MKTKMYSALAVTMIVGAVFFTGCAPEEEADSLDADTTMADETPMGMDSEQEAVATLQPTEGNNVQGEVTFTAMDGAVRVVADVTGLSPGQHGFHIHETGDCSAPDASSAGGHFAPQGTPHGAPDAPAAQRHMGDLGNIDGGEMARYERVDSVLVLDQIVGKAVIIHTDADDLTTQPTGNAGARLACGVIEWAGDGGMDSMDTLDADTTADAAM